MNYGFKISVLYSQRVRAPPLPIKTGLIKMPLWLATPNDEFNLFHLSANPSPKSHKHETYDMLPYIVSFYPQAPTGKSLFQGMHLSSPSTAQKLKLESHLLKESLIDIFTF